MQVIGFQQGYPVVRVLPAQLVYPPLRVRVTPFLADRSLFKQADALAQKIAQHRVYQPLGPRFFQGLGRSDGMVHHGVLRRPAVLQLIKRHQQEGAHRRILYRLLQQKVENGAQLAVEAQRAVTHVLGGGSLLRGE